MNLPPPPMSDFVTRLMRRGGRSAADVEPPSPPPAPSPSRLNDLPPPELAPPPSLPSPAAEDVPEPPEEEPAAPADCPRCRKKLIDPAGLGWCKACGYCRSLEEERARGPATAGPAPLKASKLGGVEFVQLLMKMPSWAWRLLGGVAMVLLLTLPPALSLPDDSLPRAAWCTAQILLGVVLIIAGQVAALAIVAGDDEKLTIKDVLLPLGLWIVAARRLPETRKPLWMSSWGLTMVLSAVFFIGGLSHWFTYLPRNSPAPPPAAAKQ